VPYRVTFISGLFHGEKDRPRSNAVIMVLLNALADIDTLYLRDEPRTAGLYKGSGVRYHTEPRGLEEWTDTPTTYCRGWGDCEDLSCIRVAELRVKHGIAATPHFTWRKIGPKTTLYHIQVLYPPGMRAFYPDAKSGNPRIEDPSRLMGMGDGKDR